MTDDADASLGGGIPTGGEGGAFPGMPDGGIPLDGQLPGVPGIPGVPGVPGGGIPGGLPPVPGGSSVGGMVQDASQMAQAAQAGDAGQAADAAVTMAATGAATYFGGEPAAQATRAVLNSAPGGAAKKGIVVLVGVVIGGLLLSLLSSAAAVTGVISILSNEAGVLAGCNVGGAASRGALNDQQNPTQEEIAGQIYAQITGYGYGDFAAGIALASAYFETTLVNKTIGDNWTSGAGMTGSRGIYQQFPNAVPPDLAWSGKKDPGYGNDYGMYDDKNAWTSDGWALRDPRMNVAQAANIFVLGMGAGTPNSGSGYWGMDSPLMAHKSRLKSDAIPTQEEVWAGMYYVQGFNPNNADNRAWAVESYSEGISWLKKIQTGKVPVPPFVPPLEWMRNRADSPETQAKFGAPPVTTAAASAQTAASSSTRKKPQQPGPSVSPSPSTSPSPPGKPSEPGRPVDENKDPVDKADPSTLKGDGITLIGDSVMEGLIATNTPPNTMFGGRVTRHALVGISLQQVLSSDKATSADGSGKTEDITKWRESISKGPSRILVQLGTNPSSLNTVGGVSQFMKLAGPSRFVYWFAPHYGPVHQEMTAALEGATKLHPNLRIIPVLDLLPTAPDPGPAGQAGAHPSSAYEKMWKRAIDTMSLDTAAGAGVAADPCVGQSSASAIDVSPGATPLPYEDKMVPDIGYTINKSGGRNMVYYSQNDPRWNGNSDVFYDGGMGQCGCGPTSFAMVIATLANMQDFTPLHAASLQKENGGIYGGCGTGNIVFPSMAAGFGVQMRSIGSDWEAARETLRAGGLVMASMGPGLFTSSAHYIVIRGMTADGSKFFVADPNGAHMALSLDQPYSPSQFNFNRGMFTAMPGTRSI